MRAIQRINHNAAICEDGAGRQLIALGRGIGFGDMPHEVDLDVVTRTFYGIDSKYLAFIDEVDPESDEESLVEIEEYVRMAVLLLHADCALGPRQRSRLH